MSRSGKDLPVHAAAPGSGGADFLVTRLETMVSWARKNSLWPFPFATASRIAYTPLPVKSWSGASKCQESPFLRDFGALFTLALGRARCAAGRASVL